MVNVSSSSVMDSYTQKVSNSIPKMLGQESIRHMNAATLGDQGGSELGGLNRMFVLSNDEEVGTGHHHMYRLVSVVEHFGGSGSGHYIVYRASKVGCQRESGLDDNEDDDTNSRQSADMSFQWFCISDSEVQPVAESEVLSAHAALLFYEKIG